MKNFGYHMPTRAVFGWGRFSELGDHARKLGGKAFVVLGRSSARRTGSLDRALAMLRKSGTDAFVFEGVEEDPSLETVERARTMFRGEGCDIIISIGGGSAMDAAKGVAGAVSYTGDVADILGMDKIPGPGIPHICVPTTSGTGSEATRYAILTDYERPAKLAVSSEHIYPRVALVDPELTLTMPPKVTAHTGMDALSHAIEGFTSRNAAPITDALALDAITLVGRYLVKAYREPDHREAREGMALASMLAGMVITHAGVGLMHSMGYPLTLDFKHSHGLANTCLMAAVMDFNLGADPDKHAMIAAALGRAVGGMEPERAGAESVAAVRELARAVQMPDTPAGLGLTPEMLERNIESVLGNQRVMANVPRTPTREDLVGIYDYGSSPH